jgi:outer membrane protein assembly factor BamB
VGAALVALAAAGLLAALPASAGSPSSNWPAYGLNAAHTSYNAAATAITPHNAGRLVLAWQFVPDLPTLPGQPKNTMFSTPAVVDGVVYTSSYNGYVYAIDEATGTVLWKTGVGWQPKTTCFAAGPASSPNVTTDPATGRLTVYIGGGDGYLYALDAASGGVVWRAAAALPSPDKNDFYLWSSPTVTHHRIYIGISSMCARPPIPNAGVRSFDQATGAPLAYWKSLPAGMRGASVWSSVSASADGRSVWAATGPAQPDTGVLYSISMVRLNARTLKLEDAFQLPVADRIHDADFGGTSTLFSAKLGGVRTPMIGECDKNGIYYALERYDMAAGAVWKRQLGGGYRQDGTIGTCLAAAIWDGHRLFAASNSTTIGGTFHHGSIRRLDPATGAVIWATGLAGSVTGSPTMDGRGVIAVATDESDGSGGVNVTYLVRATDGHVLASIPEASHTFAQPVMADDHLFVETQESGLFAYRTPGGG